MNIGKLFQAVRINFDTLFFAKQVLDECEGVSNHHRRPHPDSKTGVEGQCNVV